MSDGPRGGALADRILESPITWLFFALNLGIFGLATTKGERFGESLSRETLLAFGALERYLIWNGEPWRLLSAVFLHVGWIHLLLNLFGIFPRCLDIEKTVGSAWFAFAYVTTGVGASAVSVISHHAFGAGASGAGFGMFAVSLAMIYRREGTWNNFITNPFARRVLANLAIWTVIGFVVMRNMDHHAHVGGFLFGIPCGLLLETRRGRKRTLWMTGLAAYIFVWVGIVVAACIPGLGFRD